MSEEILKWADVHQFHAEPMPEETVGKYGVEPRVYLLWMTPDPLGAMAAFMGMYAGKTIRNLDDITDDDRQSALENMTKTHLQAPLEVVKMHFLIEGVDRAFTHQLVRQRTAVYAQESLRFAVVGHLSEATTLPPSLWGTHGGDPTDMPDGIQQGWRQIWDDAIAKIDGAYHALVNSGMPAEEARGLLPTATATRLHYATDLRNLKDHAGNRLCTQAQFHWRSVFTQIKNCIANYGEHWQFAALADSGLFRPVCYQLGHCPFEAIYDRHCNIRQRVRDFAAAGVPSEKWDQPHLTEYLSGREEEIQPIQTEDWLLDVASARIVPGAKVSYD